MITDEVPEACLPGRVGGVPEVQRSNECSVAVGVKIVFGTDAVSWWSAVPSIMRVLVRAPSIVRVKLLGKT